MCGPPAAGCLCPLQDGRAKGRKEDEIGDRPGGLEMAEAAAREGTRCWVSHCQIVKQLCSHGLGRAALCTSLHLLGVSF